MDYVSSVVWVVGGRRTGRGTFGHRVEQPAINTVFCATSIIYKIRGYSGDIVIMMCQTIS